MDYTRNSSPKKKENEELIVGKESQDILSNDIDEYFFDCCQHLIVCNFTVNYTESFIKTMAQYYMIVKLIQDYIIYCNAIAPDKAMTVEKFKTDTLDLVFVSQLKSLLLPSYKKILAFLMLNLERFEHKGEVYKHSLHKDTPEEEALALIIQNEQLDFIKFETLLAKILESKSTTTDSALLEQWLQTLSQNNPENPILKVIISAINPTFEFKKLPETFFDLCNTFSTMNCEICKDMPEYGSRCYCLICGMVLCNTSCKKLHFEMVGNLNKHCMLYHCGLSVFLNTESGKLYFVNTPKNVEYHSMYTNKFGQSIQNKQDDWKEYSLDEGLYEKVKSLLISDKIPQDIHYQILNKNKKFQDSVL